MDTLDLLRHGHLEGAQRLDLSCGLHSFPREIFELADTLEVLNLGGNHLQDLPDDLHRLHKLKALFCNDNAFTHLPPSVGRCPQLVMLAFQRNHISQIAAEALPAALRWLVLTDNLLDTLPNELGQLRQLQKLMLSGNRLHALPDTLQQCHRLELMRISGNHLPGLPDWLVHLPHLAWLSYSGNPLCATAELRALRTPGPAELAHAHAPREIDWSELTLAESADAHAATQALEATWHHDGQQVAVWLKALPPHDASAQMQAHMVTGLHPHLVGIHGMLRGHPEGRSALVMARIGHDCQPLAAPPSLASCTRDVYPADLSFDLGMVLRLADAIAAATQHLHACGVLHGDLYAHNIQWSQRGECRLGHFAAASLLPADAPRLMAHALMATEVRAFGCLLEELLSRCQLPAQPPGMLARLHTLQSRCTLADGSTRPSMAEVSRQLTELMEELGLPRTH